jgi:hypothetical protein
VAFGDSELPVFFSELGVPVVAGAQSTKAIFDAPGQDFDMHTLAPMSGVEYAITFTTADLSLMFSGQGITVDGLPFEVTSVDPVGDGRISKAKLKSLGALSGPGSGQPNGAILTGWGKKQFAETPDGVRTVFTLPVATTQTVLQVYEDGLLLTYPADYSLNVAGTKVTFTSAPLAGSVIFAYC